MVFRHDKDQPRGETAIRAGEDAPARGGNNVVRLWQDCPHAEVVTGYDRENVYLYGHLLEGEAEGASLLDMARLFFHIDVDRHPARAFSIARSHLMRAHWLTENAIAFLEW